MIVFAVFYLSVWWLWLCDDRKLARELAYLKDLITEREYEKVVSETGKDPEIFFRFRLLMASAGYLLYAAYRFNEMNLYNNIIGIIICILVYKGLYFLELRKFNGELQKASREFPYYLNNLSILINSNPVANAIYDSIETAPEIFRNDLMVLTEEIHRGEGDGIRPYLDFYNKYRQIEDLGRIMTTLYNMSSNSSDNDLILASLCKLSNKKLNEANNMKFERNLDRQAMMPWLGFFWIGFLIIAMLLNFDLSALGSIG